MKAIATKNAYNSKEVLKLAGFTYDAASKTWSKEFESMEQFEDFKNNKLLSASYNGRKGARLAEAIEWDFYGVVEAAHVAEEAVVETDLAEAMGMAIDGADVVAVSNRISYNHLRGAVVGQVAIEFAGRTYEVSYSTGVRISDYTPRNEVKEIKRGGRRVNLNEKNREIWIAAQSHVESLDFCRVDDETNAELMELSAQWQRQQDQLKKPINQDKVIEETAVEVETIETETETIENNIALIDADLLDAGTRHPNLALLKIAGLLKSRDIRYELITSDDADLSKYTRVYLSKVFTFTAEPACLSTIDAEKVVKGGTGYYADMTGIDFEEARHRDMNLLNNDPFIDSLRCHHERFQMPDYDLYNNYIAIKVAEGVDVKHFADYQNYSIGFLTKGCIRKCSFCVNRNDAKVCQYSPLDTFLDESRKYIYLWDDNLLAAKNWDALLDQLIATKKPFQFRQGLDIRLVTEEKAAKLAKAKYHGDYIFAFDNIADRNVIERKLELWKRHCKKTTKLYVFCGYEVEDEYKDIRDIFERIEILMRHQCLPYIMRHVNYETAKHRALYVTIARWCNMPQFFKKMSFREFCEKNQEYKKDQSTLGSALASLNAFIADYPEHREQIEYYFNLKY